MSLELQCNEGAFFANGPVRILRFPTTSDHPPKVSRRVMRKIRRSPLVVRWCPSPPKTVHDAQPLMPPSHQMTQDSSPFIAHIHPRSLYADGQRNRSEGNIPEFHRQSSTFPLFKYQKISPCDIFWF